MNTDLSPTEPPLLFLDEPRFVCREAVRDLSGLSDGFMLPLFRLIGENEDKVYVQLIDSEGFIESFREEVLDDRLDLVVGVEGNVTVVRGDGAVYGFFSTRYGAFCGNRRLIAEFLGSVRRDYEEANPFLLYKVLEFLGDEDGRELAAAVIERTFAGAERGARLSRDYPVGRPHKLSSLIEPSVSLPANRQKTLETVLDTVLDGDCISVLKTLPKESVDLIFADPPYNAKLAGLKASGIGAADELWNTFGTLEEHDRFTREWLSAARRVLKDSGTIWVIGSYHNIFRVGSELQNLGFWILNDVVWRKTSPMPNFKGRRFTNAHETLIWATKNPKQQYTFNYEAMKALNDELQMRSEWTMPPDDERERLTGMDGQQTDKIPRPESLLHRIIVSSTKPGDVILDPFFGSGTTGVVARRLGRHFIGIEREPAYAESARVRIAKIVPAANDAIETTKSKRSEPRIPFGWVVERGLLPAGTVLYGLRKDQMAKVRADGTLVTRDASGSIHRIAAHVQGLDAANGWTFWQYEKDGALVPIDTLRRALRDEVV